MTPPASDDPSLDGWYLVRQEVKRLQRSLRVLGQIVAQEIEKAENRQSEEDTRTHERHTTEAS